MDYQSIKTKYDKELAMLNERKSNLDRQLSICLSELGLTSEDITDEFLSAKCKEYEDEVTRLESELTTLIAEYDTAG